MRPLGGKLRLRQITRLCEDGDHQTQIITTRWDLRDIELAYRMFERWRQENYIKYMREEFLVDALVDYRIEAQEPTRTVPNPQRRALDKHIRAARERLRKLLDQRRQLPKRVEVRDLSEQTLVKLATERKYLTDLIKMLDSQAESDLMDFLRPHYPRTEQEGRTLLHELLATAGDIHVTEDELQITLAPLSSPHRTRAVQTLCEVLDQTARRSEFTLRGIVRQILSPKRAHLAKQTRTLFAERRSARAGGGSETDRARRSAAPQDHEHARLGRDGTARLEGLKWAPG